MGNGIKQERQKTIKLLTLKHWQLLGLLIGPPILLLVINLIYPNGIVHLVTFPILMLYCFALIYSWFYTLAVNLHKKLPVTATMNLTTFKIFFFIDYWVVSFD